MESAEYMEEILKLYRLHGEKITPYGDGLINKTWKVEAAGGEYILQRVNEEVFKNPFTIRDNIHEVGLYLKHQHPGYFFPLPVPAANGEEMISLPGNGHFRLFPFIKGTHTVNVVRTCKQAEEAAEKFGEFTSLMSGFDTGLLKITIPDFHNLSLRFMQFMESVADGNAERIEQNIELIAELEKLGIIVREFEQLTNAHFFPARVIHHDTKISNVLFDGSEHAVCIIDPDTIMPGYFFSDLGDMFRTYLSDSDEDEPELSKVGIREEIFRSVTRGYLKKMGMGLTDKEKEYFTWSGKFMIYMQALRFMTDYLNHDIYYTCRYEHHNLVRAMNQVRLLQEYISKEDKWRQIVAEETGRLSCLY